MEPTDEAEIGAELGDAPEVFRTVKTLAAVPGAYERGVESIIRQLSIRHKRRFFVLEDKPPSGKDGE